MKKPRVTGAVRDLAKATPGPDQVEVVLCLNCGHEAKTRYRELPERFVCPECKRRAGVRCDDGPRRRLAN